MYDYRSLSPAEQKAILEERRLRGLPKHSPPHLQDHAGFRIITAACYEHQRILSTPKRIAWFEQQLHRCLEQLQIPCDAWCILENHYHLLVNIRDMKSFTNGLGQLHGRTSFEMNKEDNSSGRTVWYRCQDRVIRSQRHYYTTLNYIHNHPVKHQYVRRWQDWPFSSFHWYMETKGREWLLDCWREHPLLDYGAGWDDL